MSARMDRARAVLIVALTDWRNAVITPAAMANAMGKSFVAPRGKLYATAPVSPLVNAASTPIAARATIQIFVSPAPAFRMCVWNHRYAVTNSNVVEATFASEREVIRAVPIKRAVRDDIAISRRTPANVLQIAQMSSAAEMMGAAMFA